jgi:hypothetical protein
MALIRKLPQEHIQRNNLPEVQTPARAAGQGTHQCAWKGQQMVQIW